MGRKITTAEFIEKATIVHNNVYDYSETEYTGSEKPILVRCPKHGSITQYPKAHLKGSGCKQCGTERAHSGFRKSFGQFVMDAKAVHGDVYIYAPFNYQNNRQKIEIVCRTHGSFDTTPHDHLSGRACKKCSYEKRGNNCRKKQFDFVIAATEVHRGRYDYSAVEYAGTHEKVSINCPKHGAFFQTPQHHLRSHGCPACFSRISKGERNWLDSIKIEFRQHPMEIDGKRFFVDGFDPSSNTVYSYHGDFWHGNPEEYAADYINPKTKCSMGELYERTLINDTRIKAAGYELVVMWESEWNRICAPSNHHNPKQECRL